MHTIDDEMLKILNTQTQAKRTLARYGNSTLTNNNKAVVQQKT